MLDIKRFYGIYKILVSNLRKDPGEHCVATNIFLIVRSLHIVKCSKSFVR